MVLELVDDLYDNEALMDAVAEDRVAYVESKLDAVDLTDWRGQALAEVAMRFRAYKTLKAIALRDRRKSDYVGTVYKVRALEILLTCGEKLTPQYLWSNVERAVYTPDVDLLMVLLRAGLDPNLTGWPLPRASSITPSIMYIAAKSGDIDFVRCAVRCGARFNPHGTHDTCVEYLTRAKKRKLDDQLRFPEFYAAARSVPKVFHYLRDVRLSGCSWRGYVTEQLRSIAVSRALWYRHHRRNTANDLTLATFELPQDLFAMVFLLYADLAL